MTLQRLQPLLHVSFSTQPLSVIKQLSVIKLSLGSAGGAFCTYLTTCSRAHENISTSRSGRNMRASKTAQESIHDDAQLRVEQLRRGGIGLQGLWLGVGHLILAQ